MDYVCGKVIFITGAGSGIGRSCAMKFVEMGAKVFTLTLKADELKETSELIASPNFAGVAGDVTDEATVKNAVASCVEKFGTVDVLINSAGIGLATPDLSETDVSKFNAMFDVNVKGVFLCTRECLKIMKPKQSGHVLTLISMAGQRTNPGAPLYCSSKFAARGFNSALADQCIQYHVKVTDINPGPVDSNYWGDRVVQRQKFLRPADVANVIAFVVNQPDYVMIREINFDNINFLIKDKK